MRVRVRRAFFLLSCEFIPGDLFYRIALSVSLTPQTPGRSRDGAPARRRALTIPTCRLKRFPKKDGRKSSFPFLRFVTRPSKKLAQTNCELTSRRDPVPSDSFPACQNLTESLFGSSAREGGLEDEVSPLSPPPVRQGLSSCQ